MRLFICSDIHGDGACMRAVIEKFREENADRLLILGDLLYHGPRNDLPPDYGPKEVISILNENRDVILSVRGNCDTEVDQMVLDFPILADYIILCLDGLTLFATHGHKFNPQTPPPLSSGDILLNGHTHIYASSEFGNNNTYLNPGSVTLPKGGNAKTYMIYENKTFTLKDFFGNTIFEKTFN